MTTDEIIRKAKSYDNEDIHFELKQTGKYFDGEGNVTFDKLWSLIVGFANQDGGHIIIGIKDDGTPEGTGLFELFQDGNKSGIDKFKELVNNTCYDKISPIINIQINTHQKDEYEFVEINVPKRTLIPHAVVKRRGTKIGSRVYYIKTSHSLQLVSDTQLEWLFNNENRAEEINQFLINITAKKDLMGIPKQFGNKHDLFVVQPKSVDILSDYISIFSQKTIMECANNQDYQFELLSEILMYSILQSYNYSKRRIELSRDTIFFPPPSDKLLLSNAMDDKENDFFDNRLIRSFNLPECRITIDKARYLEDESVMIAEIANHFITIELRLKKVGYKEGLLGENPYYSMVFENNPEIRDFTQREYDSYQFQLETKIVRLFPEVMSKDYFMSYEFANAFIKSIKVNWDIEYFMRNYPHTNRLYSVEYKLDQIIKQLNKK